MRTFHVTSLDEAPHYIRSKEITHVLSLLDRDDELYDSSKLFSVQKHTRMNFRDVETDFISDAPTIEHCRLILEWGQSLPENANVLVHCWMGMSRSTVSAFALMVQNNPHLDWTLHKQHLIRIRPIARPNRLMSHYFDTLMKAEGRFSQLSNEIHNEYYEKVMIRGL